MKSPTPTFKIDSDIPLPARQGRPCIYPWSQLGVGDSFFHPDPKPSFAMAAYHWAKTRGLKFKTAKVEEKGKTGIRVWRIS
jgi:hypothetical protein